MTNADATIIDIGQLIDDSPWSQFQKLMIVFISLAFIVDSMANNVLAVAVPAIIRDWHVTRAAFSSVNAIGWVGVALGTILAGSLADRVGRKPMLILSIMTFGLATACIYLATNIHELFILRAIDGFGIGGTIPTATTLLAEFTPTRRRSRAVVYGLICMPIGTFVSGLVGSLVLPHLGWRSLFAINGTTAILVSLLIFVFMPESPLFLARKPDRRDALLRGLRQMRMAIPHSAVQMAGGAARSKGSLAALFGRGSLGITLGLWGGFFFCFLASYTSLNWLPTLLSSHHYSDSISSLALSASGIGGIFASFVMSKLIEMFGSRIAVIFPAVMAVIGAGTLSQMALDASHSAIPVLFVIGIMGFSLNSLTCFAYALGAFVYPPAVKGTGLGAAGAAGRIGAITSSYAAVAALALGSGAYFGFIAITAVISMICLITVNHHIPSDKIFDAARAR